MASEQYGAVFEESQDDDEEPSSSGNDGVLNGNEEEDEELLEEEEDFNSSSLLPQPIAAIVSSASIHAVPLAVPTSTVVTVAAVPVGESTPDFKRQRIDSVVFEKKPTPPQPFDESRRLFQRLWTDEDEIELLQGFLDYTTSKTNPNSSHHHHHDTALFYDLIKSKLQLDFNKNQLVEKLRRLKKKYRNVMNKINSDESGEKKNFTPKSPATRKRSRNKGGKMRERSVLNDGFVISNNNFNNKSDHDHSNAEGFGGGTGGVGGGGSGGGGGGERGNVATVIEETVKCCLTPMFKVVFGSLIWGVGGCGGRGISGLAMNAMPLNFGNFGAGGVGNGDLIDERWRKQQILELEVYSKRLELVQDQIKAALEEVRSMGG